MAPNSLFSKNFMHGGSKNQSNNRNPNRQQKKQRPRGVPRRAISMGDNSNYYQDGSGRMVEAPHRHPQQHPQQQPQRSRGTPRRSTSMGEHAALAGGSQRSMVDHSAQRVVHMDASGRQYYADPRARMQDASAQSHQQQYYDPRRQYTSARMQDSSAQSHQQQYYDPRRQYTSRQHAPGRAMQDVSDASARRMYYDSSGRSHQYDDSARRHR